VITNGCSVNKSVARHKEFSSIEVRMIDPWPEGERREGGKGRQTIKVSATGGKKEKREIFGPVLGNPGRGSEEG